MISVEAAGPLATVQDLGRNSYRHIGVAESGALDKQALSYANLLVDNKPAAAAIELLAGPLHLRFHHNCWIALTGNCGAAYIERVEEHPARRAVTPCWRTVVRSGEILCIPYCASGTPAYIAIAGGLAIPEVLGSRSTNLYSSFGGLTGRPLARGDQLSLCSGATLSQPLGVKLQPNDASPRVILEQDFQSLDAQSQQAFIDSEWQVSPTRNRMGCKLESGSTTLTTENRAATETRPSQAVFPGTIQLPADGKPIILQADAQTSGGYPMIATVIEADLWKVAQTAIGDTLRFEAVDTQTAIDALAQSEKMMKQFQRSVRKHA